MTDLISVIVPIYNLESYIYECIQSVIRQTYQALEIIIIDDGSTDGSENICRQLMKQDSRIRYYRQENKGVSAARNLGLKYAEGKFVAFVDGDDTIDQNYIEILYQYYKSGNYDVVFCGMREISVCDNKQSTHCCRFINDGFLFDDITGLYIGSTHLTIGTPVCKLYKKSIITNNNLRFDETLKNREDAIFTFTYFNYCKTYIATNETFYNYMKYGRGSATEVFSFSRVEADARYLQFLVSWLDAHKVKNKDEFMSAEIVNCIRSLTYRILSHKTEIKNRLEIASEVYKRITENIVLPTKSFKVKTGIVITLLRLRLYLMIYMYYALKCKL